MNDATVPLSARLPRSLARDLKRFATQMGVPVNRALTMLLGEALAMARHPGIDFRFVVGRRVAFVTGTGLAVWEARQIWNDHGQNLKKVLKNYPNLTAAQVSAAVQYAEAHRSEMEAELDRAQPEDPTADYPFLTRV